MQRADRAQRDEVAGRDDPVERDLAGEQRVDRAFCRFDGEMRGRNVIR